MKVMLRWCGDQVEREIVRARQADDADGVRKISQAVDAGNRIWESWVTLRAGGSILELAGADGAAEIQAEHIAEVPKIRDQYATAVGSTVSVGVGTKLSEADRALMAAKLQGGDKIVLYTPEVDKVIEQLKKERSEADKLSDEYLGKAQPAANEGAHAGFTGGSQASGPTVEKPKAEGSEHSQTETAQAMADTAPKPPEATAAAGDPEDLQGAFHQAAQDQQQKDQGQQGGGDKVEQLKAQVVQVLQALKAQAPILEQVKQSAPDTYKAVMGLAQAVIMMGRMMNGDNPNQMGAREVQDRAASQAQIEVPIPPEEQEESKDKKDSKDDTKKSELTAEEETKQIKESRKQDKARAPHDFKPAVWTHPNGHPRCKLCGDEEPVSGRCLGADHDGLKKSAGKDDDGYDCKEFGHCWGEGSTGEYCVLCGEHAPKVEELDKASLSPNLGQTAAQHHHLMLPVGSQKDTAATGTREAGKVKIQHVDNGIPGKQSWVSVRAGQIMSQDGHAISARNPGGK